MAVSGRIDYPVFLEDTLVEEVGFAEMPLFSLEAGEVHIKGRYPEGSTYSISAGSGCRETLTGNNFCFIQKHTKISIAFNRGEEEEIYLLPLRGEKKKNSNLLWINPFGSYTPFTIQKGEKVSETFRFFINFSSRDEEYFPYPGDAILELTPVPGIIVNKA